MLLDRSNDRIPSPTRDHQVHTTSHAAALTYKMSSPISRSFHWPRVGIMVPTFPERNAKHTITRNSTPLPRRRTYTHSSDKVHNQSVVLSPTKLKLGDYLLPSGNLGTRARFIPKSLACKPRGPRGRMSSCLVFLTDVSDKVSGRVRTRQPQCYKFNRSSQNRCNMNSNVIFCSTAQ